VRNTRLTLCEATSRILKTGLGLLGIQTTERM
jgi:arginyl-tRNA synthetase